MRAQREAPAGVVLRPVVKQATTPAERGEVSVRRVVVAVSFANTTRVNFTRLVSQDSTAIAQDAPTRPRCAEQLRNGTGARRIAGPTFGSLP